MRLLLAVEITISVGCAASAQTLDCQKDWARVTPQTKCLDHQAPVRNPNPAIPIYDVDANCRKPPMCEFLTS